MRDEPAPEPISLPQPPEVRRPAPPSAFALLLPITGSLVLWAVTGSVLSLGFAVLGPILTLGSMAEGRWRVRREHGREERRYAERLRDIAGLIDARHRDERQQAAARTPSVRELGASPAARWRTTPDQPLTVRLGRAELRSAVRVGTAAGIREETAAQRVRASAGTLPDAPLPVDLRAGLCVVGRGAVADALVRSVLLQAACRVAPPAVVKPAGSAEPWLAALPHPVRSTPRSADGVPRCSIDDGGVPGRVSRVLDGAPWPADCDTVVTVTAGGGRVLRHPLLPPGAPFLPDAISTLEAMALARTLAAAAPPLNVDGGERVPLAVLLSDADEGVGGGLRCPLGTGPGGTVEVDLVADGPHAIVGGTTGSGKSELLRSWVLALASRYPPTAVQCLLLDFKGGASFADLERLPHTVGVLTDLDRAAAARAVESLRAELRHRERLLAATGARSIDSGGSGLARLVLVIDEFAVLAEQLPECHAVLGDVAARGRSLGMHLILCTQRPAGVVRDSLLANAGLRICLRVTSDDDSRAVVGVPDASRLDRPGTAVLALAGSPPARLQVAEAEPELVERVARAWPAVPLRRPWLPALPTRISPAALPPGSGLVFGLADRPEEQSQPPALWDARRSGGLLVFGGPRSGRSTALAAVAAATGAPSAIWPRPTPACVWDAVTAAQRRLDDGEEEPRLLLLDDVDAVLAAAGGEHAHELAERLLRILREGAHAGLSVAMAASRLPAALSGASALAGARLLLRAASRDEHLLAGGSPALFDATAPPGRGEFAGVQVQVAEARRATPAPPEESVPVAAETGLVVVTSRPAAIEAAFGAQAVRRLAGSGTDVPAGGAGVIVGSPDEWQARWSLLRQLAATQPVLFDGCGNAEVRTLLGRHELPPPCTGRPRWLFRPGASAVRARL